MPPAAGPPLAAKDGEENPQVRGGRRGGERDDRQDGQQGRAEGREDALGSVSGGRLGLGGPFSRLAAPLPPQLGPPFRRQELRELRVLQKEEQRAQSQLEQRFHQQREQMFRHIEQEMTVTGTGAGGDCGVREGRTAPSPCREELGSHCRRCFWGFSWFGGHVPGCSSPVDAVHRSLFGGDAACSVTPCPGVTAAPVNPSPAPAWQSKKEYYDREVGSWERRHRQLKECQELKYTARLRDEAKRLKALQEKDCRRRLQELKGDGKEVRVRDGAVPPPAMAPGHVPLGTICCGWPQEQRFLQQQQQELNAALQRVVQEHKKKMTSIDWECISKIHSLRRGARGWEEEEGGGVPGKGSWGGWSLGRVVVTALCSRPAAREAVVWSMEQGHLQEKYQLFRQQVTEQHALQRQQLRRRHEKVRPGPGGHVPPTPGSSVTSLLRPRAGHGAGAALPPARAGGAEEPAGPAAGPDAEKPALRCQNAPGPLQGQPEEPGGQRG